MKEGRPSLTALYVAFARAIATHEPTLSAACQDPMAERLLPRPLTRLIASARQRPHLLSLLRRSALGMSEHLALRTRLIDDAVNEAVEGGARQLVILGAGLDARAHRMQQLRDAVVFEVDHPSTQAFKRAKARVLPVVARELRYVSCDFERESFRVALESAALDTSLPTVWIWEGVTMYLPRPVIAAALENISALSALRSRVIVSYLAPPSHHLRPLHALGLAGLAALSEPIHSQFSPEDIGNLLRAHGFHPSLDVAPRHVQQRYDIELPPFAVGAPSERIVVADKRGAHAQSPG